jgi:hypothetical protein
MTKGDRVLGMFKLGASQHIEQFAQGLLYMNTLKYFVEIETSSLRRDSHEGTSLLAPRRRGRAPERGPDDALPGTCCMNASRVREYRSA